MADSHSDRLDEDWHVEMIPGGKHLMRLDFRKMEGNISRFASAMRGLREAWDDLPPAIKRRLGPLHLTLDDDGIRED